MEMETVGSKLPKEIARCERILEEYVEASNIPGMRGNMGPVIYLLGESLRLAHKANGQQDVIAMIAALRDLEGYTG
ncbi:MAG TPA: hypothetical protein VN755_07570 [Steroidobacteraceae bacterium]|jgi:hypothetical protein|nr:hypothetical protein [Steroidobacteraceae bacterium]